MIDWNSLSLLILIPAAVAGLALLYFGGDWLCRAAVALSRRLKVPTLLIGLTVVSIATSTPELFTGIIAAVSGRADVFLGNVVGSNLANIGLILGIGAILTNLSVAREITSRELPVLFAATLLFISLAAVGDGLGRVEGLVLALSFVAYLCYQVIMARRLPPEIVHLVEGEIPDVVWSIPKSIAFLFGAVIALNLGAWLLVESAATLAGRMGVSEKWIALTLVAVGTSLPELAATVAGVLRREHGMVIGNIIGSNLFNLIFVGGLTVLISPVAVSSGWFVVEFSWLVVFTTLLWIGCMTARTVERWEGWVILIAYLVFLKVALG
jgi:cation:H+ antiporter